MLATKIGDGLKFDGGGNIALNFDGNSGLVIDGGKVKINAPICTPTSTAPTATGTDKSGRLTWTGTAFDCQRITDSTAGTYGSVVAGTISMPIITVNAYGEMALSRTSITAGSGINISAGGSISLPGIGGTAACQSTGLYWTGSAFDCIGSWKLAAEDTDGSTGTSGYSINNTHIVRFFGGDGLSATRFDAGITYSIQLRNGGGLSLDGNGVGLQNCTANQILKVNSSGQWICSSDLDTITDRVWAGKTKDVSLECVRRNLDLTANTTTCWIAGTGLGGTSYAGEIKFNNTTWSGWSTPVTSANFSGVPAVTVSFDAYTNSTSSTYMDTCAVNLWAITTQGFYYAIACSGDVTGMAPRLGQLSIMAIEP
jgi:hypothetical protein